MEKLEKEWIEYPVMHIDFSLTHYTELGRVSKIPNDLLEVWENKYGCELSKINDTLADRFARVIVRAHEVIACCRSDHPS